MDAKGGIRLGWGLWQARSNFDRVADNLLSEISCHVRFHSNNIPEFCLPTLPTQAMYSSQVPGAAGAVFELRPVNSCQLSYPSSLSQMPTDPQCEAEAFWPQGLVPILCGVLSDQEPHGDSLPELQT